MLRHYFFLIIAISLMGCKPTPLNYDELMTHPDMLGKAMMHCRMDNFTGTNCETIQHAESDFTELVNERATDPMNFGKKILAAETSMGELHAQYQKTKSPADEKSYEDAKFKVDVLLAVLKATFTEAI